MATSPQVRRVAREAGLAAVRMLGQSRQRRANRGKWYFGRRVGIPASRRGRNPGAGMVASTSTSQPVARSARVRTQTAQKQLAASGVDWLTDVSHPYAGTDPYVESFAINPAEPSSFPRLSSIAAQYQRYDFVSLELMYTPSCPTTQKGVLYIAPVRDPTAPNPLDVLTMRGLSGCVSTSVRDPCRVVISRQQMSGALNGFYCEAPEGVTPDDDDPLRTCGRVVLMVDGVLNTDGVVGTLILRYNFLLSDPKVTPEGAALSGEYHFAGSWTGTLDPDTDAYTVAGKSPLVPGVEEFVKRSRGPVMIIAKNTASDDLTLEVDGTELAKRDSNRIGSTNWYYSQWWIPPGRQRLVFKTATTCGGLVLAAHSTGAVHVNAA